MGMRFRKSVKIAPGVKVNLNSKSVSVTAGVKGAHHTVSSNGSRTSSVGIPGTGLSYSKTTRGSSGTQKAGSNQSDNSKGFYTPELEPEDPKTPKKRWYQSNFWIIFFLIVFFPVGLYLMWRHSKWNKVVKVLVTAFFVYAVVQSGSTQDSAPTKVPAITATPTPELTVAPTETPVPTETPTPEPTATPIPTATPTPVPTATAEPIVPVAENGPTVWISGTGSKYHSNPNCSNMSSPTEISLSDAESRGYEPCKKCY